MLSLTPSVNLIMTVPWIHTLRLPHVGSPSLTLFSGDVGPVKLTVKANHTALYLNFVDLCPTGVEEITSN